MKRSYLYFLAALLVFSVVVLTSLTKVYKSVGAQSLDINPIPLSLPCPSEAFTMKRQPEATIQLSIVEANCNGPSWNARLTLENVGHKAVRGYEVANAKTTSINMHANPHRG